MKKKLLSIVIPAFNEELNIPLIYKKLSKILWKIEASYDYEIILINDGSRDQTWKQIKKLSKEDKRIKWVNLSRNFGHQAALTAWLDSVEWDIIVTMDADMQDPPSLILEMIEKWESGAEIVFARRKERHDNFFKKYTALLYYKILTFISDTEIPKNVWDFRLFDKKVLKAFKHLKERDRFIRGIFAWVWFKKEFVDFDRPERGNGETGYSLWKMMKLAMDGILNFSTFPLKIGAIIWTGMIVLSTSFFLYIFYDFFIIWTDYPLFKWISVLLLGFMGLQFIFMWILWEYIARIYNETKERPIYITSETVNLWKKK